MMQHALVVDGRVVRRHRRHHGRAPQRFYRLAGQRRLHRRARSIFSQQRRHGEGFRSFHDVLRKVDGLINFQAGKILSLLTWKMFVVVGESLMRSGAGGGGGESTSSSGDTEHERLAHLDRDELRDRDFEQESLQLDVSSEWGEVRPCEPVWTRWWFWCSYVLLLSSSSESGVFTSRLTLKLRCSAGRQRFPLITATGYECGGVIFGLVQFGTQRILKTNRIEIMSL